MMNRSIAIAALQYRVDGATIIVLIAWNLQSVGLSGKLIVKGPKTALGVRSIAINKSAIARLIS